MKKEIIRHYMNFNKEIHWKFLESIILESKLRRAKRIELKRLHKRNRFKN